MMLTGFRVFFSPFQDLAYKAGCITSCIHVSEDKTDMRWKGDWARLGCP